MEISIIVSLMGGLGLFLLGMKQMSDGLEKAAGAKMRSILEAVTTNRIMGTLVGILFCAVIQSSSATTVMVVSFVNSGLMQLSQAAGPILGANIGTTVTGQLIAFNLAEIAPLFVIIGAVMYMFFENQNVKKIGIVLLGFGILFMGLSTMGERMTGLQDSPQIVELLQSMRNPMVAIMLGFVVTAVLLILLVLSSVFLFYARLRSRISPPILVLDEITANLDDDNIWDMFQLLQEVNRMGTTVIMATHASRYVNIMRRRVITLVDGKIFGDVEKGRYGDVV